MTVTATSRAKHGVESENGTRIEIYAISPIITIAIPFEKMGDDDDRRPGGETDLIRLSAQSNADRSEGAFEAQRARFSCVDAHVHGAKEEVRTIAKARFEIFNVPRKANRTADIRYDD